MTMNSPAAHEPDRAEQPTMAAHVTIKTEPARIRLSARQWAADGAGALALALVAAVLIVIVGYTRRRDSGGRTGS